MLEAIRQIGELARAAAGSDLDTLVKDLASERNYSHVLLLVFDVANQKVTRYAGVKLEEIASTRKLQYLYRKGSGANGPNVTPTSLITTPEKTLRGKVGAWLRTNVPQSGSKFLESLSSVFDANSSKILADVDAAYKERSDQKKGYAISFLFREGGSEKYVGDFPEFRSYVEQRAAAPGSISRRNHVCSVCGQVKPIVYGDVVPGKTLKFYTLDKPGYIASGFDKRSTWKNFPLCGDCALDLEAGTTYVMQHLNFSLGGTRFYLVPKELFPDRDSTRHILQEFRQEETALAATPTTKSASKATSQEKFHAIRQAEWNSEHVVLRKMGSQNASMSFDLLFYDVPQPGVFKVLQHVQDVAPSRAQLVASAIEKVDESPAFQSALFGSEGGRRSIEFSFWQLAQFFKKPDSARDQTWKQEYLGIVADVFTGARVDTAFILQQFVRKMRDELLDGMYHNEGGTFSFEEWTLRAFNTLLVMQHCHVLPTEFGEVQSMEGPVVWEQLFGESHAINTAAKKAVFLTGLLTQRLLGIQWQERHNKPFFKELKGLRLKEQDVKGLLPKIINKLEEYDKNFYVDLEQEAAAQFACAGDNWDMSIDEINFIFSLGMALSNRIKQPKEANDATTEQK